MVYILFSTILGYSKPTICCWLLWNKKIIIPYTWASYQIRKNAGCACARNARYVSPATSGQRSRHTSRHVRDARVVMHAGIVIWWLHLVSVDDKRSRHSRRMRNPQFCVSGKRPIVVWSLGIASNHSRLIPMYNARFILWPSSLSSPIRKKLVNGQMPEMRSQPLKQSLCLATQSQLGQSIATNREIRIEKFQNFISIFRELFAMDSHW